MSEMVERVAMAIHVTMDAPAWDRTSVLTRDVMRVRARAAIAAMREPTEDMRDALSATGKMWRELNSETVWQTYIDAALKD